MTVQIHDGETPEQIARRHDQVAEQFFGHQTYRAIRQGVVSTLRPPQRYVSEYEAP